MLGILILFHILFIIYFIYTGTWYFNLIPLFFLLFIIFHLGDDFVKNKNEFIKTLLIKNIFILGRLSINLGLLLLSKNYIGIIRAYIFILSLNISFFIISYLFSWHDGKLFSHIGLYLGEIIFPFYLIKPLNFTNLYNLYYYFTLLNFGIYTFVVFIIGSLKPTSKHIKGLFFLFLNLVTLNLVYLFFCKKDRYLSLVYTQIYLSILFTNLSIIKKLYFLSSTTQNENTKYNILEKILKGEKVFTKKEKKSYIQIIIKQLWEFINGLPGYIKLSLGLLNLTVIIIQILIFTQNIHSNGNKLILEIGYWSSIFLFLINFLLLKYLNFYYFIQRIFLFFILNFGIYLTIINIFGKNILHITIIGTLWNLLNGIAIFFTKYLKKLLTKEDFYLRIVSNLCAFVVNVYFINLLKLNLDIKFGIITLYFGIQIFLTYYNFKYLKNVYEKKYKVKLYSSN